MDYYLEVLKKYAVFEGRARRKEYWMFFLFNAIIAIVLGIIGTVMGGKGFNNILSVLYGLALLVPGLAVAVRRLHDTNHSAWWLLMNFIPIVGTIIYIVLLATKGQPGDNKYGPNPKETGAI